MDTLATVAGAVRNDRDTVLHKSRELGFLTGAETEKMERAHVNSVMIVGKPYQPEPYNFKSGEITGRCQIWTTLEKKFNLSSFRLSKNQLLTVERTLLCHFGRLKRSKWLFWQSL